MFSQFRSKDKADDGKDKNDKDTGKTKDEKSDTKGQTNNKDSKQQTKSTGSKQQTTTKDGGNTNNNTSNTKSKDSENKDDTNKYSRDGQQQGSRSKYGPDEKQADSRKSGEKQSNDRNDKGKQNDKNQYYGDGNEWKSGAMSFDDQRHTRGGNETYRGGYGDQRGGDQNQTSGGHRKYTQESGGEYPAGKLNRVSGEVYFTGEETRTSPDEEEVDEESDEIVEDDERKGMTFENNNEHSDRNNRITTFKNATNSQGILKNENFKRNQWRSLGDKTQIDDFREDNNNVDIFGNGSKYKKEKKSNLIHNIGDNIADEIYNRNNLNIEWKELNEKIQKDSSDYYTDIRSVGDIRDQDRLDIREKEKHFNVDRNGFEKVDVRNRTEEWDRNVLNSLTSKEIDEKNKNLTSSNAFLKETTQKAVCDVENQLEMNTKERPTSDYLNEFDPNITFKDSDKLENKTLLKNHSATPSNTLGRLNSMEYQTELAADMSKIFRTDFKDNEENMRKVFTTDLKDNEEVLQRLDTNENMDQPFTTPVTKRFPNLSKLLMNTRNWTPRRLGNKVSDLEEQKEETIIDNTPQKGFLNKVLLAWDRIPRHLKGLLFVILAFALFAFVLERICLHKTKK